MNRFAPSFLFAGVLLLGAAPLHAGDNAGCVGMTPAFGVAAADAGGLSPSTGEQIEAWALLAAHIERADGRAHPAFDGPHRMFLFTTVGGRYVVRILDRDPDWPDGSPVGN